jgi:hypothetical protein
MSVRFLVILAVCLVGGCSADNKKVVDDNTIQCLVLSRSYQDGGYTVVSPETGFLHSSDLDELKQTKEYILQKLKVESGVTSKLVDELIARNKKSVHLTIKSSPENGYLIDNDGQYEKYFKKDGGGWERCRKEHPKACGMTTISLPVYDSKTGLVLIYVGTQSDWLAGSGWVIAYKYENGKLKELNKVMMWVS